MWWWIGWIISSVLISRLMYPIYNQKLYDSHVKLYSGSTYDEQWLARLGAITTGLLSIVTIPFLIFWFLVFYKAPKAAFEKEAELEAAKKRIAELEREDREWRRLHGSR